MGLRFGSMCSGIEAASCAWNPLGWRCAWLAENDPFCCELLKQRWPQAENLGDVLDEQFLEQVRQRGAIDVLVGGTPCQGFSASGRRAGLDDPRSRLVWRFLDVARQMRPGWIVWENVPGVLSQNRGQDFAAILGEFSRLGYGLAWRMLDAQYFGVPQSRDRVFLIGNLRDWRRPAGVLFERESLYRYSPPRRQAKADVAHAVAAGAGGSKFGSGRDGQDDFVIAHAITSEGHDASEDGTGRGIPLVFDPTQITSQHNRSNPKPGGPSPSVSRSGRVPHLAERSRVRKLTPREVERLFGFDDDYTLIEYRGGLAADSPRYKALGNSIAVPVLRWIGERIEMVQGLSKRLA